MCMNAAYIFKEISDKARSIVLASGTLAPTDSFASELGSPFPNMLHANHVITEDQVYIRCISKGPRNIDLKGIYNNVQTWNYQVCNIMSVDHVILE